MSEAGRQSLTDRLVEAVRNDEHDEVARLLEMGASLHDGRHNGCTAIYFAESPAMVMRLAAAGANLNTGAFDTGITPLYHLAALENRPDILAALIEAGADVNRRETTEGRTPLHQAIYNCQEANAAMLLSRGADPQAQVTSGPETGATPLHFAAMAGLTDTITRLLGAGANIDGVNGIGATPLHYAATHHRLEAIRLLCEKGANVNMHARGRRPIDCTPDDEARAYLASRAK